MYAKALAVAALAASPVLAQKGVNAYWGQTGGESLASYCDSDGFEYVTISFITQSPEQDPTGYPSTNFGAHCSAEVFSKDKIPSKLGKNCQQIIQGIPYCQSKQKKVLLSIGGEFVPGANYTVSNAQKGEEFADFLWGAFGPYSTSWTGPRPFDKSATEHVSVDGFDLDIETKFADQTGYIALINRLRAMYATVPSKQFLITGAPQCPLSDQYFQMKTMIQNAKFDILFIQFYNNPACDAISGNTPGDKFNFDDWATFVDGTASKGAKLFIGLPGAPGSGYLEPAVAYNLMKQYKTHPSFGGASVWDVSLGSNKTANGRTYYENLHDAIFDKVVPIPTATPSATPTATVCTVKYTVKSGDYCYKIAVDHGLADADALIALTPGLNCDKLQPGDVVCLKRGPAPVVSSTSTSTTSSRSSTSTSTTSSRSSTTTSSSITSSRSSTTTTSSSTSSTPTSTRSSSTSTSSSSSSSTPTSTRSSSTSTTTSSSSTSSSSSYSSTITSSSSSTSASSLSSSSSSASSVIASSASSLSSSASSAVGSSASSLSSSASSAVTSASVDPVTSVSSSVSADPTISVSVSADPTISVPLSTGPYVTGPIVTGTGSSSGPSVTGPYGNSTVPSSSSPTAVATGPLSTGSSDPSSSVIASPTAPYGNGTTVDPITVPSGTGSVDPHTSLPVSSPAVSDPASLTTSTIYSTTIYTITACPSSVPNCPGKGHVTTEVIPVGVTVCPVSAIPTSAPVVDVTVTVVPVTNAPAPTGPAQWTTSTIYSTTVYTITSCAPTVTNCPAGPHVTTDTIAIGTTVCPVSGQPGVPTVGVPVPTGGAPGGDVPAIPTDGAHASYTPIVSITLSTIVIKPTPSADSPPAAGNPGVIPTGTGYPVVPVPSGSGVPSSPSNGTVPVYTPVAPVPSASSTPLPPPVTAGAAKNAAAFVLPAVMAAAVLLL